MINIARIALRLLSVASFIGLSAHVAMANPDWLACGESSIKISAPACDRFAADTSNSALQRAQALFNKAVSQKEGKQTKSAAASLEASIELSPTAEAYFLLALIEGDRRRYEQAESHFLKALEMEPENTGIMISRAVFLANARKITKAIEVLDAAYAIDPEDIAILNNRANLREQKKDRKGAKADFAAAAERSEQLAQVYRNKSRTVIVRAPGRFVSLAPVEKANKQEPDVATRTDPVVVLPTDVRVALIIGNSGYKGVSALRNPANDAKKVAEALTTLGFKSVDTVIDADRQTMISALQDFQAKADAADWSLVYFAGHGIEVSGTNYLIPTDAKLLSDRNVEDETVSLDRVLSAIDRSRKLKLVVLDACRNNPFEQRMERSVKTRTVTRGLARIEPTSGTLVLYAAKDGQVANDGGGQNSPFAEAMLKRLKEPGVEINKMFRLVTADVLSLTGNAQQPFAYGSTPGAEDFYFSMLK